MKTSKLLKPEGNSSYTQHAARSTLSRIMLALLLASALGLSGLRAQTNTEYNFRQQSVIDGHAFNSNGDPVPILTMDCLAANGYGQWTLSSSIVGDNTYPPGWYLLANGLYSPCTHFDPNNTTMYPQCIPPGIVQNGCILGAPCGVPSVAEPKATANLDGAVSFVWPDRTGANPGSTFAVQGFRSTDIDISLSFLSNPAPPMNITPGINSYPVISTSNGTLHNVVTASPFQDEFDVCSDAAFIYITWCSTTNMSAGVGPSEIWFEVVDINTMAPVVGPTSAGSGMRPTIACDPRNNRTAPTAPKFELAFIAPVGGAYIGTPPFIGGSLVWETFLGSFVPHTLVSPPAFLDPTNANNPPITFGFYSHARALVSSVAATGAWHAACYAIVDAGPALILYNADDQPNIPVGLAAFVDGPLIPPPGQRPPNGIIPAPLPPPDPPPAGWPVKDAPIVAFANTYDNQNVSADNPSNWRGFDQFHCLYQLDLSTTPGQPATKMFPLIIVRNADNGEANPLQPNPNGSFADTRLILNQIEPEPSPPQLLDDPSSYCAAVNQMGIHVHWRTASGIHFYSRDMNRQFDEDIDENTLVTDQCTVSDGSATGTNHGGTVGATIQPGKEATVWTDPNYGANPTDFTFTSGLYQPVAGVDDGNVVNPFVGQLHFVRNNMRLTLEGWNGVNYVPAKLAVMPFFYFVFDPSTSNEGVTVNDDAVFDYYGLLATHNSDGVKQLSSFINANTPEVTGPTSSNSTIDLEGHNNTVTCQNCEPLGLNPGYLKVHGGAEFHTEQDPNFLNLYASSLYGNYGDVELFDEPNIFPLTTGSANGKATGHMTLSGYEQLNFTVVRSYIPSGPSPNTTNTISLLQDKLNFPEFDAESCSFENYYANGAAEISLMNTSGKVSFATYFNNCYFNAMKIHDVGSGTYGFLALYVDGCSFYNMHGRTIFVENTLAPTGLADENYSYGGEIGGNYFVTINSNLDPDDADHGTYGVYFKNIDGNWDGHEGNVNSTDIQVHDNQFTHDNWEAVYFNPCTNPPSSPTNLVNAAAICLENSTGNLLSNTISDAAWTNGIWLKATAWNGTFPQSNSLLCSNTISNLVAPGCGDNPSYPYNPLSAIRAEYHIGRSRLNSITSCDTGYSALGYGHSYLAYNTVDNTGSAATDPLVYGVSTALAISSIPQFQDKVDMSNATSNGGQNTFKATYNDSWALGLVVVGTNSEPLLSGGNNNFYLCSYGYDDANHPPTDNNSYILKGLTGALALGDIDNNFWGFDANGTKIDPANEGSQGVGHWNSHQLSQYNATGISFSPYPSNTRSTEDTWSGITCDVPYARAGHKLSQPLSLQADTTCDHLEKVANLVFANRQWAAVYDTNKLFVQTCPSNQNCSGAFGDMTLAVQAGGDGPLPAALLDFRQWLLKALAWNTTNPNYFCSDVNSIAFTFGTSDTSYAAENTATNKSMSILYWLDCNPLCTGAYAWQFYNNSRGSQEETWFNTQDTTKVKLDTTKYSMHDLGLDSVLKYASMLDVHEHVMQTILSNALASPNPAGGGTIISFGVSKESYVFILLFDVLGHDVTVSGFGGVVQPGNISVPISLQGLPDGTYYARIQTTYGETQTVKLVKQ